MQFIARSRLPNRAPSRTELPYFFLWHSWLLLTGQSSRFSLVFTYATLQGVLLVFLGMVIWPKLEQTLWTMKQKFSKKGSQYQTEMAENVVQTGVQMGSKWGRRGSRWRLGSRGQKNMSKDSPPGGPQEPLGGPGAHFDDMLVSYGEPNGRKIVSKWGQTSHQNLV